MLLLLLCFEPVWLTHLQGLRCMGLRGFWTCSQIALDVCLSPVLPVAQLCLASSMWKYQASIANRQQQSAGFHQVNIMTVQVHNLMVA